MRAIVDGELGAVSCELEKYAAGLGKIDRIEPEAIDPSCGRGSSARKKIKST
jgi:hypothetical protein